MRPHPYFYWTAAFLVMGSLVFWRTVDQHRQYWNTTLRRVQVVDFNLLHASLPYAFAFLEARGRADLIQNVCDASFGLFEIIYTDRDGVPRFRTRRPRGGSEAAAEPVRGGSWSHVYVDPREPQVRARDPYDTAFLSRTGPEPPEGPSHGRVYLRGGFSRSLRQTLTHVDNWKRLAPGGSPPSDYFFSVVANLMTIVALGALCFAGARMHNRQHQAVRREHAAELAVLAHRIELSDMRLEQLQQERKNLREEVTRQDALVTELLGTTREQAHLATELKHDLDALQEARDRAVRDRDQAETEYLRVDEELQRLTAERAGLQARLEQESARGARSDAEHLRARRLFETVFPDLGFSSAASKELERAAVGSAAAARKLFHLLAGLQTARGSLEGIEGRYAQEVKKFHAGGRAGVVEVKLPPARLYCTLREDRTIVVEYVVLSKDARSDKDVENYFAARPAAG